MVVVFSSPKLSIVDVLHHGYDRRIIKFCSESKSTKRQGAAKCLMIHDGNVIDALFAEDKQEFGTFLATEL